MDDINIFITDRLAHNNGDFLVKQLRCVDIAHRGSQSLGNQCSQLGMGIARYDFDGVAVIFEHERVKKLLNRQRVRIFCNQKIIIFVIDTIPSICPYWIIIGASENVYALL